MWDYSFMLPCAFTLAIVLGFYFSKPRLPIRANRTFLVLLALELVVMAADVISSWVDERYASFPVGLVYAANMLFFVPYLARAFWFYLFMLHVIRAGTSERVASERLLATPFVLFELTLLSSFVTGAVFSIGETGYVKGPLYNVLYTCSAFYIAASLVLLWRHACQLTPHEVRCGVGYNLVLVAGNVMRFAFPRLLVMDTFCTAAVTIIFWGYMNPDIFVSDLRRTFNKRALRVVLSEAVILGDYYVLGFAVQNYNQERGMLGGAQMDETIGDIGRWLAETFPRRIPFYLGSGHFALVGQAGEDWDKTRRRIHERFERTWDTGQGVLRLGVAFVSVARDSGLTTADAITNMLTLALDAAQQEGGMAAEATSDSLSIQEINRQVSVLRQLEHALENNEVEVFLQPVYESKTRRMVAAEALARIRDDEGKIIPPGLFVPVAERTGHINELGTQVFDKTCEFIAKHDLASLGLQWVNVNLSPLQCMQQDLEQQLTSILHRHGVSVGLVHLEITEQSMGDYTMLQREVMALKSAGFVFVLDDYGTGYSNLTRVKHYPFQNIKLDMSVVWDYYRERDNLLPVVVRGFRDSGYSITAEGIETEDMADALEDIGSDYLQGYLFSRPLPLDDFVQRYTIAEAQ